MTDYIFSTGKFINIFNRQGEFAQIFDDMTNFTDRLGHV